MTKVAVTTAATVTAKLQSNYHHQQTKLQFLQARCRSCCPTSSVKALKGRNDAFTQTSKIYN